VQNVIVFVMDDKLKKMTIEEWRQLGYFYDRDDINKLWIIIGSPFGIKAFANQLFQYSRNASNKETLEHEHWGPYCYLKIQTYDSCGFDKGSIFGSLEDLKRLAELIYSKVQDNTIGTTLKIREEYSNISEYTLELRVMEYGFDPAKADKVLWE
jgi:hypothetical protein